MKPPGEIKFLADVMLGKLGRYLLITGHDCLYRNSFDDEELVSVARSENRVILSRDSELVRNLDGRQPASLVKNTGLRKLLTRVKQNYNLLFSSEYLFSRCLKCNEPVVSVDQGKVRGQVPEETYKWIDRYYECPGCEKVYWRGSHYEAIKKRLREWNLLDE